MANFELKICDLHNAFALGFTWADRVISLVDPDCISKPNFSSKVPHLILTFDDIIRPREGEVCPTKEQIESILEFTADIKEGEKVLIHCHGGVSRSTAVAVIVLVQHGDSPGQALARVLQLRKQAWPNELIIKFGDELLEKNGALIKFIELWMESNAGKIIT